MRVARVKTEVACIAVLNAGHFGLCSKKLFVNTESGMSEGEKTATISAQRVCIIDRTNSTGY